ncbi:MAG: type II and III secretion system protein [Balneolia bacterium]|nr:type II and III secretion system protein [Balneolia bacterium]
MRQHILTTLMLLLLCAITVIEAKAQDRLPVREFTPRDAVVSIDRTMSFRDVISVMNDFSMRFEERPVINRTEFTGPVGVSIPGLYWYDALEMVVAYNGLVIQNYPDRIEIVPSPEVEEAAREAERDVINPSRPIYGNTREIEISATFFQADRNYLRQIGVNWSAIRDGIVNVSNFTTPTGEDDPTLTIDGNLSGMFNTGQWQVDALLSVLESTNRGEIIASPRVKVLHGETGRIQVGQDISIKQRDFAGNVIDQFFSTGTILSVVPYFMEVDGEEFIYMEIEAERSTAQPDPVSTVINKQEATTRVLLLDGEMTAIGGLYETEYTNLRRGVPILKDLPGWFFGLRYIFGFESVETIQQELVIIIQAEMVPSIPERVLQDRTRREILENQIELMRQGLEP